LQKHLQVRALAIEHRCNPLLADAFTLTASGGQCHKQVNAA